MDIKDHHYETTSKYQPHEARNQLQLKWEQSFSSLPAKTNKKLCVKFFTVAKGVNLTKKKCKSHKSTFRAVCFRRISFDLKMTAVIQTVMKKPASEEKKLTN